MPEITPSPFTSLQALSSIMRLVPPDRLRTMAERHASMQIDESTLQAESGKRFCAQTFLVA